jgi:hypothetical protein
MARKPVDLDKAKQEMTSPAHEVIAHLYKALLNMEPFTLMDGTPVRVEKYVPPEINDAGEAECGVDVILPNGHLEFMMRNTGWGKSFAGGISKKPPKRGHQR